MLVVCIVIGGIGVAVYSGLTASEDRFKTGDCLHFEDGEYKGAGCDEQKAGFRVYATKAAAADCVDVPGVSSSYYAPTSKGGTDRYCIGDKDVDLAKAINGIDIDDCVVVDGSGSAEKASCDASDSRPVLKVLKDVSKLSVGSASGNEFNPNECVSEGAKETKLTYSWGLEDQGPNPIQSTSWDRVLCLGGKA